MLRRNCSQISHLWCCSSAAAGIRSISSSFDIPAVSKLVAERKIFDSQLVASGTTEFCNLKFDATYSTLFPVEAIADHAYGYLTAIARSKYGSNFFHSKEKEKSAFYFTTSSTEGQLRAMRRIDGLITRAGLQATHGASVRCYSAANSDVVFYSVEITPYVSATPKPEELSTSVLGTKKFIESKSEDVKAQYQALMDRVFTSTKPAFDMTTDSDGETIIISLATLADRTTHLAPLSALILEAPGATIVKKFCETFSNGVHVYRFYVRGCSAKLLEKRVALNALLPNRPNNMITALHEQQTLTAEETIFAHCLITFAYYFTPPPTDDDYTALRSHLGDDAIGVKRLNNLRNTLSQEMTSERYMGELFSHYPTFAKKLYADFLEGSTETSRAALRAEIHNALKRDGKSNFDADLFDTFLKFNASVLKHNFACANKAALAFRLDPEVFMKGLDFPRVPHGIFFFVGGQWRGFHVRFTEIARGGVRMIISTPSSYRKNKLTVFQENYNLAFTQLLKNKDIPEGGSKGTLLVSSRYINKFDEVKCKQLFLQYVDALLDVIIPGTEGVVDNYKKEEIIFLGPDENTAGTFPKAGALYSRDRGYSAWKSFTTGKDPDVGGIPHDTYGMTTRSVRQCVEGIYRKLGMDEKAQTKFQTGGPDGDLGSNEILRSNEKYLALVDISASVYDPAGVNKDELVRLARARLRLEHFNPKCLSPKGFLVKQTDKNVKLPDGTVVADGAAFRDTFHLSPYTRADVFVPCGGRPASVTLQNVHELINVDGATGEAMLSGKYEKVPRDALKYKVIVEGANLFLTQDARLALERCGVVIIKDSTANKGGVTSSSLEVLAGLSLSDEEHQQLMRAKDQHDAPQFYKDLVAEICARVEKNAAREFEAIWKEHLLDPKRPKTLICDALSEKIVNVRTNILRSNLFNDQKFLRYVMESYTPKTLQAVVPIDTLMQRVPANYQHAICAMWLASDYVYKTGDRGTEFDFFQFMQAHFNEATK